MIKPKMTWEPAKARWRKMYRGKIYTISCDALGCPGTKADSYMRANAWWMRKKTEIDNQQPVGKWSHEIKTLEQRRNWLRAHGQSDQAAGYTSVIEDLSDGTMDDLHPSIVGELVHPGDRLDAVWQDRLSRDDSLVPQERLMSQQINRYIEFHKSRAIGSQISVPEYDQIRVCLTAFQNWVGSESLIDSVTPDRWEQWYLHLLSANISVEYQKKQFRHSRNFLDWLGEKGLIQPPVNLHSRRYRFVGGHKDVPTIPVEEVTKILAKTHGMLRLHILLFLNCGMTQVDISDLHPSEVDWQRGRITRRRSKTEKKETTPVVSYKLWQETMTLLKQFGHHEGDHVLLTHTGRPWVRDQIVNGKRKKSDSIKSLYVHLKLDYSLKLYRKTGATVLSKKYPECVELYLGHSPRTITQRSYVPPDVEKFDEAINWLGQQFGF